MARPSLLTPALIQRITDTVAIGGKPESARVSSRTMRDGAQGRAELEALHIEALDADEALNPLE